MITWATDQRTDLAPKAGETFGIVPMDPEQVPPEDFCFDLGIKVPNSFTVKADVHEKILPEGIYAVTLYKGPRDQIGKNVNALYQEWLPTSGQELGDFPCVFCYHNFDHEVAASEHLTEIRLLMSKG